MSFKGIIVDFVDRSYTETEKRHRRNHSTGNESHLMLWHGREYTGGFFSPQTTSLPLTTTSFQGQFYMSLSVITEFLNLRYTNVSTVLSVRTSEGFVFMELSESISVVTLSRLRSVECRWGGKLASVGISDKTDTRVTMHRNRKTPVSNYSQL